MNKKSIFKKLRYGSKTVVRVRRYKGKYHKKPTKEIWFKKYPYDINWDIFDY